VRSGSHQDDVKMLIYTQHHRLPNIYCLVWL